MIHRSRILVVFFGLLLIFKYCSCDGKTRSFSEQHLSPVIFVPGDGGNQLEARLHKSHSSLFCSSHSDWYSLWLNIEMLLIPAAYCWVDNFMLHYDNITRTTRNTPGVEIRVPGWGEPEVVEWIDPTHNKHGAYFNDITDLLVDLGYTRKKNIHGAPYDFRKAPHENEKFFNDLKILVEDSYEKNHRTPVTFITHSMGSPMTLVFLQKQTSEWKQKYVQRQISLAGAWAGSVKSLKVFSMGDDLDSVFLFGSVLKAAEVTMPSASWLLPSPMFWKSNEVLVETPSKKYTVAGLENYFNDINYRIGWEMFKDSLPYIMNFSSPGVELHCLYGEGIKTVEKLHFNTDNIASKKPKLIMGNGDGAVNIRSLRACERWHNLQTSNTSAMGFPGVSHQEILHNNDALNYIKTVLKL